MILRHISGKCQAYLRHRPSGKSIYILHTSLLSLCLFLTVSQDFLDTFCTASSRLSIRFSSLFQSCSIGFSILSQSLLDTLKTYQNFLDTFKSQSLSPHSHVISCLFELRLISFTVATFFNICF